MDDYENIRVTAWPKETLLFVSQQYHSAWRATAGRRLLRTVRVNQFYQGVLIPPMIGDVELSFHPLVLWSWVPQLFFAATATLILVWQISKVRANAKLT
jgi:hypothetical protein